MQAEAGAAMWNRDDDLARAHRAAEGDESVLRDLIAELKPRVWRRAWSMARPDYHRAEDLTQEGLACALRPVALRQYAGAAPLLGYLSFIAQRRMLAVVRPAREQAWARTELSAEAGDDLGEADPTFDSAAQALDAQRVTAVVDALPPDLGLLVRLKAGGAPNQEIAALLDIPVGTVKSRFARACHHMRTQLEVTR